MSRTQKYVTSILLFILTTHIILPLLTSLFIFKTTHETREVNNKLVIKDKEGKKIGYIFGSLHSNLTPTEYEKEKEIYFDVLQNISHIFTEVGFNAVHWTNLPNGIERLLGEGLDKFSKDRSISKEGLETAYVQTTMVNSNYFFMGKQLYIPYGDLYRTRPGLAGIMNSLMHLWILPANIVYYNLVNPEFIYQHNEKNTQILEKYRKDFLNGDASQLSSEEIESFQIIERDQHYYNKIKSKLSTMKEKGEKFFIIIGTAHLGTKKGILSHFEKDGYTIEPYVANSE